MIDRTALVENILNQIIISYCGPRNDAVEFMWGVVLDTSVMSLGAKIKVTMAVAHEIGFKLNRNPLHKVVALRNAFAHHATDAYPVYVPRKHPAKDTSYYQLWVLESSGMVSRLKRDDAFEEFNIAYKASRKSLVELKNLIQEKVKSSGV